MHQYLTLKLLFLLLSHELFSFDVLLIFGFGEDFAPIGGAEVQN